MRKAFLVCTLLLVIFAMASTQAQLPGKRIMLLPFYDESGYKGPWKLRYEVPQMLGDMLMDEYFEVVDMDSVKSIMGPPPEKSLIKKVFSIFSNVKDPQRILTDTEIRSLAKKGDADYVITGIIEKFNYNRKGGGDPMIGGYKSYTTAVKVEQVRVINVASGTVVATVRGEDTKNSRGLGLELFGKPRKLDLEFYSLDSLDFGSKRFLNSLIGQAVIEALNNARKDIRAAISAPDSMWFKEKNFKVVSVDAGTVHINAGSSDGITAGDRFRVFTADSNTMVGKINVTTVWSDHLSVCQILEGQDEIRPGDLILPDR